MSDPAVLYQEFAEAHLTIASRSGAEWNVLCPIHGESRASMRFNVEKGAWFCHGCGARGTVSQLAKFLGVPFTIGEDSETQMSILRAKLAKLTRTSAEPEDEVEYWPENRLTRFKRMSTTYWTDPPPLGRGFTQDTIDAFDLGYDPLEAHAIVPLRDEDGNILGVTRRDLTATKANKRPKYLDPKAFNKGENLFASWLAKQSKEHYVVLTEGPLDAVKVWQSGHPAVAQYGSKLTARQIKLLRTLGFTTVVLAYDNDTGGAECLEYAFGFRTLLNRWGRPQQFYLADHDLRNFFVVKDVQYPAKVKDPGDMEDQDLSEMICASRYIGYAVP